MPSAECRKGTHGYLRLSRESGDGLMSRFDKLSAQYGVKYPCRDSR